MDVYENQASSTCFLDGVHNIWIERAKLTNIASNSSVDSSSNTLVFIKQESGIDFCSMLILLVSAFLFFLLLSWWDDGDTSVSFPFFRLQFSVDLAFVAACIRCLWKGIRQLENSRARGIITSREFVATLLKEVFPLPGSPCLAKKDGVELCCGKTSCDWTETAY